LPATPLSLIAMLRAVAYGWRQDALAANAREISALGAELYQRLITLGAHWTALGKSLAGAVKSYNDAMGSLETRVLVSARKLRELHAVHGDDRLEPLASVELAPREPRVEEPVPSLNCAP
jgi:DNA recombination protein RmuC